MMAVGGGIVGAMALAGKSAAEYQTLTTALVTGAGEAKANLDLVSQGMLDMSGRVGVSADELAKGMYMIESAGYHGGRRAQGSRGVRPGRQDRARRSERGRRCAHDGPQGLQAQRRRRRRRHGPDDGRRGRGQDALGGFRGLALEGAPDRRWAEHPLQRGGGRRGGHDRPWRRRGEGGDGHPVGPDAAHQPVEKTPSRRSRISGSRSTCSSESCPLATSTAP